MKKATELYTELTDSIIAILEEQQISWDKPWICLDEFGGMARNASSGRMYSMLNQILLSLELKKRGYTKNAWLTFKQIKKLGGGIKKGQKAVPIYFNTYTWRDNSGESYAWNVVKNMGVEEKDELGIKCSYYLTSFMVFNVTQTKDLPEIYYQLPTAHQTIAFEVDEAVIRILVQHEETLDYSTAQVDQAYYNVEEDLIILPTKEQFKSPEAFYATFFHELVHWTGHESRLNRTTLMESSKENYADEEIIAELGSVFLCAQLGLSKDITQNAGYIQYWLKALKEDNRYIMKMISYAERACSFILGGMKIEELVSESTSLDETTPGAS